jgi:hypothetical protein
MVATLVITLAGHARPCPRAIWPAGDGRDNAITRIRGDLIVRLSSGEPAGTGECRPDRAGF